MGEVGAETKAAGVGASEAAGEAKCVWNAEVAAACGEDAIGVKGAVAAWGGVCAGI